MIELAPWLAGGVSLLALVVSISGNRSKALSEKIRGIYERVDKVEDRLTKIEADMRHVPDKDSMHRVEMALSDLKSEVRVVSAQLEPVSSISNRLQEFLLEQAERR